MDDARIGVNQRDDDLFEINTRIKKGCLFEMCDEAQVLDYYEAAFTLGLKTPKT